MRCNASHTVTPARTRAARTHILHPRAKRSAAAAALGAAALLTLAGCAAGSAGSAGTAGSAGSAGSSNDAATAQADAISIENPWIKTAESGMTAGFGTLENDSDADITVVSVASEASPMMELHETVQNESGETIMREVEGGFVIPANGEFALEPGANHIMMMDLPKPILAGDEVTFTLTLADDSKFEYTALAKDYAGANENYDDADDAADTDDAAGSDTNETDHSGH